MSLHFTIVGAVEAIFDYMGLVQLHFFIFGAGADGFYYIFGCCSYILLYVGLVQLHFTIFKAGAATFYYIRG